MGCANQGERCVGGLISNVNQSAYYAGAFSGLMAITQSLRVDLITLKACATAAMRVSESSRARHCSMKGEEALALHRAIENIRRGDLVAPQGSDECRRLRMAVRDATKNHRAARASVGPAGPARTVTSPVVRRRIKLGKCRKRLTRNSGGRISPVPV
jgi:hypothetical protein